MSYHSPTKRKIYERVPYALKCVLASGYGVRQRRIRHGRTFRDAMEELQTSSYWSAGQIADYQRTMLSGFLENAIRNTAYYRGREEYSGGATPDAFITLPVLKKQDVQDHMSRLVRDAVGRERAHWGHTSGTTGRALVFPISDECFQREYAFRSLHYSWGGVDFTGRDRLCFCSGHPVAYVDRRRPPFWVHDWANNWLMLSSYHLTEANLPHYIRKLESFEPVMLGGYPSSLYLLALAYRKHGTGTLKMRAAFTASESLFDRQREAIEEAFGVKVYNWYGNSEMCGHITECEHETLHGRHEHSLIEVLDADGNACSPGQTGRLVATGFHNRLFPLIRYEVGDEVTLSRSTECPCGRTGLMFSRIAGRDEDYIATPDGRLIGRLDHLFKDSVNVWEAQVVQREIGEVIFRIVKRPEYTTNDEQEIVKQGRLRLGSSIDIRFDYVEEIERTAGGKFRFIVSEIDQRDLLKGLV